MLLSSSEIQDFLSTGNIIANFAGIETGISFFFNTHRLHDETGFSVQAENNNFMAIIETDFAKTYCAKNTTFTTKDNVYTYSWKILTDPIDMANGFTKLLLAGNGKI